MLSRVCSVASFGLETVEVSVEINIASKSFPAFSIVGLPNKAIEEAKERVRTALINSGIEFPQKRITVNLAPADRPKTGSCYDLPIAVGIMSLVAGFSVPTDSLFYGELSLDGSLRHTRGVFLTALWASQNKITNLFVPKLSANEAAVIEDIRVYPVKNLAQLALHFNKSKKIPSLRRINMVQALEEAEVEFDFAEILGQEQAKRAMEIAAAGGHNIFMEGPPGAGKTMLSRALPGILPPLTKPESLEVTQIYSVAGRIPPGGSLIRRRPFRTAHHSASRVGLIGGGSQPQPGEISLAHRGVLFLDEIAEFPRSVLEALRQPLEDGVVTISRAAGRVSYPAQFILAAAANPCPCGFLHHPKKSCKCSPRDILRYKRRLSGPLMDRIDLHVNVPAVEVDKLSADNKVKALLETSETLRKRVISAREQQSRRFNQLANLSASRRIHTNAEMRNREIRRFCPLSSNCQQLLKRAVDQFQLSARAYFRLIKISRTIADLAGVDEISEAHVAEALQYRMKT